MVNWDEVGKCLTMGCVYTVFLAVLGQDGALPRWVVLAPGMITVTFLALAIVAIWSCEALEAVERYLRRYMQRRKHDDERRGRRANGNP